MSVGHVILRVASEKARDHLRDCLLQAVVPETVADVVLVE